MGWPKLDSWRLTIHFEVLRHGPQAFDLRADNHTYKKEAATIKQRLMNTTIEIWSFGITDWNQVLRVEKTEEKVGHDALRGDAKDEPPATKETTGSDDEWVANQVGGFRRTVDTMKEQCECNHIHAAPDRLDLIPPYGIPDATSQRKAQGCPENHNHRMAEVIAQILVREKKQGRDGENRADATEVRGQQRMPPTGAAYFLDPAHLPRFGRLSS